MGSIKLRTIVCVLVAMTVWTSTVQANYHVSKWVYHFSSGTFYACPSNYYNCKCFKGDRRGGLTQKPPSLTDFFDITNLCGYPRLNHYRNGDGTYSVYAAGGDGKVVATCYGADIHRVTFKCLFPNVGTEAVVYDYLICYGQPCQPDSISTHGLNTSIH